MPTFHIRDNVPDIQLVNQLHIMAAENNVSGLTDYLKSFNGNINEPDQDVTAVYIAASLGYDAILKLLLEKNASLDQQVEGLYPIDIALLNSHYQAAALMLAKGGKTSLYLQKSNISKELKENLFAALKGLPEDIGTSALFDATQPHTELGKIFFTPRGIDMPSLNYGTLLLIARYLWSDRRIIVPGWYRGQDAQIDSLIKTDDGEAITKHFKQTVGEKFKLDSTMWVYSSDNVRYLTPLYYACGTNKPKAAQALIDAGADVNQVVTEHNRKTYTSLEIALISGHDAIIQLLLKSTQLLNSTQIDVTTPTSDGNASLLTTARYGRVQYIDLLIHKGAEIGHQNNEGETALIRSARFNQLAAFQKLLAQTPSPLLTLADLSGQTVWHWAAAVGNETMIATLIEKDPSNMNQLSMQGQSPLRIAASPCKIKAITLLLKAGATLDKTTLELLTHHSIKADIFDEITSLEKTKAIPELKKILDKTTPLGEVFHAQRNSTLLGGKAPSLFNPRSVLYDVVQELERLGVDVLPYRRAVAAQQDNPQRSLLSRLTGGRGNSDIDRPNQTL